METLKILRDLHHMPGANYYEVSILIAGVSMILQYLFNRKGNKEAANLCKGLTLLGLGLVFVESIMKMLRLMGSILNV